MKYVTPLVAALLVGALMPGVSPASAAEQNMTQYEWIIAHTLERTGGVLPETAIVDGGFGPQVVAFEDALVLLRENNFGMAESDGVVLPTTDAGTGVRAGPNGCLIGAIATSFLYEIGEAIVFDTPAVQVPDGAICGGRFASWVGDGSGTLQGDFNVACVNNAYPGPGLWVNSADACQLASGAAGVAGRVGYVHIQFCFFFFCYTIDQMFSGTANSPAAQQRDAGLITLG